MSRCRRLLAAAGLAAALAGCAAEAPPRQSDADTDAETSVAERGLRLASRQAEENAAISGRRIRSETLEDYVRRVNCRVTGDYCSAIRVYTMRVPDFNASMAPNGFEQIWTGLLLRVENEAQLATVLGHEAAHYTQRHSLERFRTTKRTSHLLMAAQMGVAIGNVGPVSAGPVDVSLGDVAALLSQGYLAAYSREQEAEADRRGFEMLADAGYAPDQAAAVWGNLMAEQQACDLPEPPALFASHPPAPERLEALKGMANDRDGSGEKGTERYQEAIAPYRGDWLEMALAHGQYCRTGVVLERLIDQGYRVGELYYYQGELHRLRSEDGDLGKAIEAYKRALDEDQPPAATHRGLGLALWRDNRPRQAAQAFQAYLDAADDPADAAMIEDYLERLP